MTPSGERADLKERIVLDTGTMAWQAIDELGAVGKLLERRTDGSVVTALLRLEPAQRLPEVSEGREIYVLGGVLELDGRDYGPGGYMLVPEGRHSPARAVGTCELYWQAGRYGGRDRLAAAIDTSAMTWVAGLSPGLALRPLYSQEGYPERGAIVRWDPGSRVVGHDHPGGEEFLVLAGVLSDEHGDHGPGTWVRNPDRSVHQPFSTHGCAILVKTGGLPASEPVADEIEVHRVSPETMRYSFPRPFPCDYDALLARLSRWSRPRRVALYATTEAIHVEIDVGSADLSAEEQAALARVIRGA